jgi:cytochrome c biogenesis protein CcmG/thiol:disulfide interchange protein DsbE
VRRSRTALVSAGALGLVLAVLILVLATSKSADERQTKSPLVGKFAPALVGTDITGPNGTWDIGSSAAGKWVLVNFFGTYCIPCQIEHPDLVRFSEVNADSAQVVSVVFDDKVDNVTAYFDKNGGTWPVLNDPDGSIATRWGVARVPESYLISPNGVVVSKITGGVQYAKLEDLLTQAQASS